ncbi:MAG: DUF3368 domain-containing protein [Thiomargarita sp.]|nr:DUF3368 domain-containing protein [Thiomargarita sp.]
MDKYFIIDASPLIFLTRANQLNLLRQIINSDVIVPAAVETEIRQYGKDDITAQMLAQTNWLKVVNVPSIPNVIQKHRLGMGESAVLAWSYLHSNTEVIIDDLSARRCASALNIPMRGTLGLVLIAKQRGIIPAARPIIEKLRQSGMYLSDVIINQALSLIKE